MQNILHVSLTLSSFLKERTKTLLIILMTSRKLSVCIPKQPLRPLLPYSMNYTATKDFSKLMSKMLIKLLALGYSSLLTTLTTPSSVLSPKSKLRSYHSSSNKFLSEKSNKHDYPPLPINPHEPARAV